jgi:hypothetical protein
MRRMRKGKSRPIMNKNRNLLREKTTQQPTYQSTYNILVGNKLPSNARI